MDNATSGFRQYIVKTASCVLLCFIKPILGNHYGAKVSSRANQKMPPHTSPARTLYHSRRLKDPQTKDAFTSALAKKVSKISHTFSRLTTHLHSSKITPQSFADTANAALSEILQHAAHVVLGKVDPHTPKNVPNKSTAHHTANHHSSQNPQEAHLQSTIRVPPLC